jgi:hypothetical protein
VDSINGKSIVSEFLLPLINSAEDPTIVNALSEAGVISTIEFWILLEGDFHILLYKIYRFGKNPNRDISCNWKNLQNSKL